MSSKLRTGSKLTGTAGWPRFKLGGNYPSSIFLGRSKGVSSPYIVGVAWF